MLLQQLDLSLPFCMGVPVSSTRRWQFRLVSAEMVLLPCALFSLRSSRHGDDKANDTLVSSPPPPYGW